MFPAPSPSSTVTLIFTCEAYVPLISFFGVQITVEVTQSVPMALVVVAVLA
jgi:hypothetical protein